jgi:hypothetical protein
MRDHPDISGFGDSRGRSVANELGARERGRLVGREVEVAVLADFLVAGQCTPQGLVLDGEAGIGKTTLFDATLMEAREVRPAGNSRGRPPREEVMTRIKAVFVLLLATILTGAFAVPSSAAYTGSSPRRGALHVTKECSQYTGAAGAFCTITSSNLNAIKPGSRVVYASAAGNPTPGMLDTDLVIDGPGANTAFGHVVLDLSTGSGVVTFSGGTGVFIHFQAGPIVVLCPVFPSCSWDGPYSFTAPR